MAFSCGIGQVEPDVLNAGRLGNLPMNPSDVRHVSITDVNGKIAKLSEEVILQRISFLFGRQGNQGEKRRAKLAWLIYHCSVPPFPPVYTSEETTPNPTNDLAALIVGNWLA